MTSSVWPDNWTPQVWSHAELIDMQARLDPVRITGYADHWRRVLDDARAVFTGLDVDMARHLNQSWRGDAGRRVLEAFRRYVVEAIECLDRYRSLADGLTVLSDAAAELRAAIDGLDHEAALAQVRAGYSGPAVAAGNAVGEMPMPAITSPAGHSTMPSDADWSEPAVRRSGPGVDDATAPQYPAGFSGVEAPRRPALRDTGIALAGAPSSPAVPTPAVPTPAVPTPAVPARSGPAATGMPYAPVMGAAYPGAMARGDAGTRRAPKYLISVDNGNELIGPLPKVAPPVLGDW